MIDLSNYIEELVTYRDTLPALCPNCERLRLVTRRILYHKEYPAGRNLYLYECEWCGEEYQIYGDVSMEEYHFRLILDD